MLYAQAQVEAGIRLLNSREPDWRESINWEHLDMSRDHQCVLGQIYGEFGIHHVYLRNHIQASNHGFYRCDGFWFATPEHELEGIDPETGWQERYDLLTETWRALGPQK